MNFSEDIKRIIVIDDCRDTLFIHRYFFNCIEEKILVDGFWNVDEAIKALKNSESKLTFPDLILCDINLPLKDGFEFIKEYQKNDFHKKWNETLVIFQSCWINEKAKIDLAKIGEQYMLIEKAENEKEFLNILQLKTDRTKNKEDKSISNAELKIEMINS